MRYFSAAACLLAAFGIAQIVTGANPPGERMAVSACSSSDACDLTGTLAATPEPSKPEPPRAKLWLSLAEPLAEPAISRVIPSVSQAEEHKPVASAMLAALPEPHVLPEPQPYVLPEPEASPASAAVPHELAALEPEPLAEPEPPPTVAAEPQLWVGRWRPFNVAFAFAENHAVEPIAKTAIERTAPAQPWTDAVDTLSMPLDAEVQSRAITRIGICSAIVAAARGNNLPVPFFANLIWQESNFRLREISGAGALGVAQFIPETAHEHGLINPFEPIHAIHASAKFLRRLNEQYHNLGFAAAAYNAGPGRVNDWLAKRRRLPGETRAYVNIITGHRADRWASAGFRNDPDSRLMPAKAPCPEVAEEVEATVKIVGVARLMQELAAATRPPVAPAASIAMAKVIETGAMVPLPRRNPFAGKLAQRSPSAKLAEHAPSAKLAERAPTAVAARGRAKPAHPQEQPMLLERALASAAEQSGQRTVAVRVVRPAAKPAAQQAAADTAALSYAAER